MQQYDKIGGKYSKMILLDPIKEFVQRPSAVRLLGNLEGGLVLDAGCGDGIISRMIAAQGAKVVGFDPSPHQIKSALAEEKKLGQGIEYFIADDKSFSYPKRVDKALACMVLPYMKDERALQDFFSKMFSLLKEGGIFSIIDADKEKLLAAKEYYGRIFKPLPDGRVMTTWKMGKMKPFGTEVNYFPSRALRECAAHAGFEEISFGWLSPNKEGVEAKGEKYWKRLREEPIWFGLVLRKP